MQDAPLRTGLIVNLIFSAGLTLTRLVFSGVSGTQVFKKK